jgi:heme/copper-type cytochrome/quinol oxidase subunit 2
MDAGLVVFNWTAIFQIANIILWCMVIFLIFRRRSNSRIEKLENEVNELKSEIMDLKKQAE